MGRGCLEHGELVAARWAPRGPHVDQRHLAAVVGEVEAAAVERAAGERRRGLVDQRRLHKGRVTTESHGQHDRHDDCDRGRDGQPQPTQGPRRRIDGAAVVVAGVCLVGHDTGGWLAHDCTAARSRSSGPAQRLSSPGRAAVEPLASRPPPRPLP